MPEPFNVKMSLSLSLPRRDRERDSFIALRFGCQQFEISALTYSLGIMEVYVI